MTGTDLEGGSLVEVDSTDIVGVKDGMDVMEVEEADSIIGAWLPTCNMQLSLVPCTQNSARNVCSTMYYTEPPKRTVRKGQSPDK